MKRLATTLILLPLVAVAAQAWRASGAGLAPLGTKPAPGAQVKAEIAADRTAVTNGDQAFLVAVTLTTNPHWHIYWTNPGEGGLATTFKWNLPPGFTVEPLEFPVPTAFIQPGDIHVIGYEGQATFLFRIVPPSIVVRDKPADPKLLSVTADWLVCDKDLCVPGKAALELSLPFGTPQPANKELFAEALAHIPQSTPPADIFAMAAAPVAVDAAAGTWKLQLGWSKMPTLVEAFTPVVDGLLFDVTAAASSAGQPRTGPLVTINRTLAGSTMLDLKTHVYAGQQVKEKKLPVLIVYAGEDGKRRGFYLNVDAAAVGVATVP